MLRSLGAEAPVLIADKPVVLVLEENAVFRSITAERLRAAGFEVVEAANSAEAEQVLKSTSDARCTVNSFSLYDFAYMWLDKDTVIMTYTATQDATCEGKKQGGKVFATSIWQKKGSQWLSPFHQETVGGSM